MNTDEPLLTSLIDTLTGRGVCFALYRLPWQEELHLVWQEDAVPYIIPHIEDLNDLQGFVLAPFHPGDDCPLLLIRPEHVVHGAEKIQRIRTDELPSHPGGRPADIPSDSRARYERAFRQFHDALHGGALRKLVLSRQQTRELPEGFSIGRAFMDACQRYPRVMNYVCYTPVSGLWMGCTPEILLSVEKGEGHTVSLAGTMPVTDSVEPTDWDEKNRREQEYVSEYIRTCLSAHGLEAREEGPYTARAGELVHLKTDFRFPLPEPRAIGNLLADLHPTPAVCGLPKEEAYRFIAGQEGVDRRYYAGFVGWMDPKGDTQLYVNLRCMEIQGHTVVLYAGGGILASSDVDSEWEETEHKLATIGRTVFN